MPRCVSMPQRTRRGAERLSAINRLKSLLSRRDMPWRFVLFHRHFAVIAWPKFISLSEQWAK